MANRDRGIRTSTSVVRRQFGRQSRSRSTVETATADFVGDVVVDVPVGEHAAALLLPLAFLQAALDAALAVAQPLRGPPLALALEFFYPGLHLKHLAHMGEMPFGLTGHFSRSAEVFQ